MAATTAGRSRRVRQGQQGEAGVEKLVEGIVSGEVPPGQLLAPEGSLPEEYGV